jgi:hypothetical protein
VLGRFGDAVKVGVLVLAVLAFHILLNVMLDRGELRCMNVENVEILFTPDETLFKVC